MMFSMPNRHAHCAVLPTKTSLQCIQFAGVSFSFRSAGSHVSSTSFMNLLVLTIFVTVTLSMVSHLLIVHCHLALISLSWRGFSWMTHSHLRTHMRYANSDRRIWSSCDGPWRVILCCCLWLFLLGLFGHRVMLLQPRIVPRVIWGQGILQCGHRAFARCHMVCVFFSLHCVNMWLIDSISLHVAHLSLSLYLFMWLQYLLIMWVLCIVLYRNCWMISLIVFFCVCFHMAVFVSNLPVTVQALIMHMPNNTYTL